MTNGRNPLRALKVAIVLAVLFNLLALLVLVFSNPIVFTVFMFVGQPLFVIALLVLIASVLADLRTRGLF